MITPCGNPIGHLTWRAIGGSRPGFPHWAGYQGDLMGAIGPSFPLPGWSYEEIFGPKPSKAKNLLHQQVGPKLFGSYISFSPPPHSKEEGRLPTP
ncbi:UNVERIFIED_CONTAM: hypothetical protein Sradi_0186900 [Sesamum radiatum]|uniref:Chlorophyll a-b binding protein, chloroplastic n=1 Tax=Sesamum radiatum TaxID=300843 RepID=A0AAW2W3T6_SESRA